MLTGNLAKIGDNFVLTSQIINVRSGKIVNAQRADGSDLFMLVDDITDKVRAHLGVVATADEQDAPVAERTTSSTEAFKHYTEGVSFLNRGEYQDAIDSFEKALEIDSIFTQPMYPLAVAYWWRDNGGANAIAAIDRLVAQTDRINEEERQLAEGLRFLINQEWEAGLILFEELAKRYPYNKNVMYGLAESYFHTGNLEMKSLETFEKTLDLDPEFTGGGRHRR